MKSQGPQGDGKGGKGGATYGFDSSSLEKAATAAKYLDSSGNAKAAIDLALKTEETKQAEFESSKM